jgi:hypothetical protein
MSETLAEKTCTPCRGGIPPLTGDEAQRLQAQAPNFELGDNAHRVERSFRFRKHSLLFKKSVNSPRPKAITLTSAFLCQSSEAVYATHPNRQSARNSDNGHRARAGEAGRGAVIDD